MCYDKKTGHYVPSQHKKLNRMKVLMEVDRVSLTTLREMLDHAYGKEEVQLPSYNLGNPDSKVGTLAVGDTGSNSMLLRTYDNAKAGSGHQRLAASRDDTLCGQQQVPDCPGSHPCGNISTDAVWGSSYQDQGPAVHHGRAHLHVCEQGRLGGHGLHQYTFPMHTSPYKLWLRGWIPGVLSRHSGGGALHQAQQLLGHGGRLWLSSEE
jgi:hypothetical protein